MLLSHFVAVWFWGHIGIWTHIYISRYSMSVWKREVTPVKKVLRKSIFYCVAFNDLVLSRVPTMKRDKPFFFPRDNKLLPLKKIWLFLLLITPGTICPLKSQALSITLLSVPPVRSLIVSLFYSSAAQRLPCRSRLECTPGVSTRWTMPVYITLYSPLSLPCTTTVLCLHGYHCFLSGWENVMKC